MSQRSKNIYKLIFLAKYFESYFNLELGHFYWDTQYHESKVTTNMMVETHLKFSTKC